MRDAASFEAEEAKSGGREGTDVSRPPSVPPGKPRRELNEGRSEALEGDYAAAANPSRTWRSRKGLYRGRGLSE